MIKFVFLAGVGCALVITLSRILTIEVAPLGQVGVDLMDFRAVSTPMAPGSTVTFDDDTIAALNAFVILTDEKSEGSVDSAVIFYATSLNEGQTLKLTDRVAVVQSGIVGSTEPLSMVILPKPTDFVARGVVWIDSSSIPLSRDRNY